jgi:hypothetical protein
LGEANENSRPISRALLPTFQAIVKSRSPASAQRGAKWLSAQGRRGVSGFKVSRFQGFKVSRFQGFKVSRFQGFKRLGRCRRSTETLQNL